MSPWCPGGHLIRGPTGRRPSPALPEPVRADPCVLVAPRRDRSRTGGSRPHIAQSPRRVAPGRAITKAPRASKRGRTWWFLRSEFSRALAEGSASPMGSLRVVSLGARAQKGDTGQTSPLVSPRPRPLRRLLAWSCAPAVCCPLQLCVCGPTGVSSPCVFPAKLRAGSVSYSLCSSVPAYENGSRSLGACTEGKT